MNKISIFILLLCFSTVLKAQTEGVLTVTATTSKTSVPTYQPYNILAIWIEDSNGKFVKTLMAYAQERRQYLIAWKTATTIAGASYNTTDAISGATLSSHGTRSCTWDGKNRSSSLVADGNYILNMELTDNDGKRQNLAEFSFAKGTSIQTLSPATTNGFSNISVEWKPINTSLEDPSEQAVNAYFDESRNLFVVEGENIIYSRIYDANGKLWIQTSEQNIHVADLPEATYIIRIETNSGKIIRKITKK